jgi:hypothetical protein
MEFEKLYEDHYVKVGKISRQFSRTTGVNLVELQAHLNGEFYFAILDYNETRSKDVSKWLNARLKARAMDFVKSYIRREKKVVYFDESNKRENDEEKSYEIIDEFILEDYVIDREQTKTDADKRQLINALLEDADDLTTAIVNEILSTDSLNLRLIGRTLGTNHVKVMRRLEKLKRNYDANRFGDINNYLAV